MASLSFFKHSVRPKPFICAQCLRQRNVGSQWRRGVSQAQSLPSREHELAWKQTAAQIRAGETQSMLSTLEQRGYVKDIAGGRDALDYLLTEKRVGAYVGVDPTAPSLHVGHLLPFMALFWMYLHGYHSIMLVGGMTANVGDPIGRSTAREQQSDLAAKFNVVLMRRQLKKLWTNVGSLAIKYGYGKDHGWSRELLNNQRWLMNLSVAEFLSVLGSGVRLGSMLSRDTVKTRMQNGSGMSFAEFSYPLLQAWDWWTMYQKNGVQIQIGGSDQYGNIVAGIDAVNYLRKAKPNPKIPSNEDDVFEAPFGFTTPLLTTSSGEKFGKSAGNAVWLDPEMLSSYDLYQYFMRSADADVERYLKLLTFIPLEHIELVMVRHHQDPSQRVAQRLLAGELVELAHGAAAAKEAARAHLEAFSQGTASISLGAVKSLLDPYRDKQNPKDPLWIEYALHKERYVSRALETDPRGSTTKTSTLPMSVVREGTFPQILEIVGLVSSKSEAHRLIKTGGVYATELDPIDELRWTKVDSVAKGKASQHLIDDHALALRVGKTNIKICHVIDDADFENQGLSFPGWEDWKEKSRTA